MIFRANSRLVLIQLQHRATLEKVIDAYYLWAHELHPRSTFPEFIDSAMKLCRERATRVSSESPLFRWSRSSSIPPPPQELCYELLEREYSVEVNMRDGQKGDRASVPHDNGDAATSDEVKVTGSASELLS